VMRAIDRRLLRADCAVDGYLSSIAPRDEDHRFLSSSAIGVYQRQALFLSHALPRHLGRPVGEISILDWGCGKGHATYLLRQAGFSVTSCDVEHGAGDSAFDLNTPIIDDNQIQVVPLRDDAQLPFGTATFDCVTSFGVLEHVQDDAASLREIHRVLRPGGVLFISFLPYFLSWTQRLAHIRGRRYHDRLYSRRATAKLVTAAGFEIAGLWHGQLFPKASLPASNALERVDRFLTDKTPLRYFATNLEAVLIAA